MTNDSKEIYLTCEDGCTTLRFTSGPYFSSFEMLDSRITKETPFKLRIKQAWHDLFGESSYYAEVLVTNPARLQHFLQSCLQLIEEEEKHDPAQT